MNKKYTLQKYAIYNNIIKNNINIFKNDINFPRVGDFVNTILHFDPNRCYQLLNKISYDIYMQENFISEISVLYNLIDDLDTNHPMCDKYKSLCYAKAYPLIIDNDKLTDDKCIRLCGIQ